MVDNRQIALIDIAHGFAAGLPNLPFRLLSHHIYSGDTIDLSSSSKKTAKASATMDSSKLKALMALRGKALEKQSGNYVPARKRKADGEEREKRREKVGGIGQNHDACSNVCFQKLT